MGLRLLTFCLAVYDTLCELREASDAADLELEAEVYASAQPHRLFTQPGGDA